MKNKRTAALLAFFLGWLGADCFYLGRTGAGIGRIVLTVLFFPASVIWSLVSMVKYLSGGATEFAESATELPDYVWGWHWRRHEDLWCPAKIVPIATVDASLPDTGDIITVRRADGSTSERQVMDRSVEPIDVDGYAVVIITGSEPISE